MTDFKMTKALFISCALFAFASVAKADYWMTFCAPPGDNQTYCQVGYVKPDADGFVTLNCGGYGGAPVQTIVVYKTQVWYRKMPGNPPTPLTGKGS